MAYSMVELIYFDKSKICEKAREKTADTFKANFRNILRLMKESNNLRADTILPKVKCPVHAIWGSHDVITPYVDTLHTFERFGISSSVIRDCGHSPMYEKPEEFASLVNYYLA